MTSKNSSLDVLRIMAMLGVLLVHIGFQVPAETFAAVHIYNTSFVSIGARGVQLFFMLSGCLICFSLEKSNNLAYYYKKRILRIIPAYYVALIVSYLYYTLFHMWYYQASFMNVFLNRKECNPLTYLRYVFFAQHIVPSSDFAMYNNLNGLWTMSSFFVFYLIAPLLVKYLGNFRKMLAATVIMCLLNPYMANAICNAFSSHDFDCFADFVSHSPLCTMYCFMMGMTVYYAIKEYREFTVGVVVSTALIFSFYNQYYFEYIFILLLMIALKAPMNIKSNKLSVLLSKASEGSFAVYLFHPLCVHYGLNMSIKHAFWGGWRMAGLMFGLSILVPYILYFCVIKKIEDRMKRWGNKEGNR